MREILWAAFTLAGTSYALAAAIQVAELVRRSGTSFAPWGRRLLATGGALQSLYIVLDSIHTARFPMFSLHSALGLVALVAVLAYLALSSGRRLGAVGAPVAVTAFLLLMGSQVMAVHPTGPDDRWLLAFHITTNLIGLGVLLVAGAASVLYLVQERRLKHKRLSTLGPKLPPLETLDQVLHRLLWAALPLLTAGIISGMVVILHVRVISRGEFVRAGFSYLSWILVATVWTLRQRASWRGRWPAYATLAGTACIMVVITLYVVRDLLGGGL